MRDLDSFTAALEEAKRDTQAEEYLKKRGVDKILDRAARLADRSSIVTEEDREEEKRRAEEAKKYAAQTELMVKLVKAGYRTLSPTHHFRSLTFPHQMQPNQTGGNNAR